MGGEQAFGSGWISSLWNDAVLSKALPGFDGPTLRPLQARFGCRRSHERQFGETEWSMRFQFRNIYPAHSFRMFPFLLSLQDMFCYLFMKFAAGCPLAEMEDLCRIHERRLNEWKNENVGCSPTLRTTRKSTLRF